MKIDTISVITYVHDSIQGITSFKNTAKGRKEAEKLFTNLIKENYSETSEEDIEACLDNGYFEEDSWQVFIAVSS